MFRLPENENSFRYVAQAGVGFTLGRRTTSCSISDHPSTPPAEREAHRIRRNPGAMCSRLGRCGRLVLERSESGTGAVDATSVLVLRYLKTCRWRAQQHASPRTLSTPPSDPYWISAFAMNVPQKVDQILRNWKCTPRIPRKHTQEALS